MVPMLELIAIIVLYIVPLYITNASALLFGGKHPIDFNKKFLGKPLLGKGKTIEGTISGITIGLLAVFLVNVFFQQYTMLVHENYLVFGAMLCVGALTGDITASFIKRRLGIPRGGQVLLLDQLDFVIGGMAFSYWMRIPALDEAVLIVAITLVMHRLSNYIAFKFKIKTVPW